MLFYCRLLDGNARLSRAGISRSGNPVRQCLRSYSPGKNHARLHLSGGVLPVIYATMMRLLVCKFLKILVNRAAHGQPFGQCRDSGADKIKRAAHSHVFLCSPIFQLFDYVFHYLLLVKIHLRGLFVPDFPGGHRLHRIFIPVIHITLYASAHSYLVTACKA